MKIKLHIILILLLWSNIASAQLHIDWQHCFIGPDDDKVSEVLALDDGFFLLGSFGIKVNNPLINHQYDVWLIKTDLNGNILWDRKYGGSKNDVGVKILKTHDNNFIIVAKSGSNDYDLGNSPYPTSTNFWIYKINHNGDILWSKIVGGNWEDWPVTATITSDNGVIVLGHTQSADGDVSVSYGSWDIWAVKLDVDGNKVWDYTIGTQGGEFASEIVEYTDGGMLIGGSSDGYGNGNIDCDFSSYPMAQSLITKLDSNLNLEWQHCYGGSLTEWVNSITLSESEILACHTVRSTDGDLSNSGHHGELDIWFTRLDSLGNLLWGKCYGGSHKEAASRLFIQNNGDLLVFGYTESNDYDVQGNHSPGFDIWVFKIDSSGVLLWQQCLGGIGQEYISAFAVTRTSSNSYVVAAETFGSFGTGDINCNTTAATAYDIWLFKVTDTTVVSRKEDIFSTLTIYPNPANEYITIRCNETVKGYFSLFNSLGDELISGTPFVNESHFRLNGYRPGIYFYRVKDFKGNYSAGRLIIN